jgi:peptidoglycan/xylan/chitin deacetylase (PgdA/CDA1 family)
MESLVPLDLTYGTNERSSIVWPWWKRVALGSYYCALAPYRRANLRRWERDGRAPVMALMYHRVADDLATPWTVSNAVFEAQIEWLRANFDLVTMAEAQRRIREGNHRPAVCITFDDGYAANCEAALPLLVKLRVPCVYFVTSRNVIDRRPFMHDIELGADCPPNTMEQIRALADAGIEIGGHTRTHADLGIADELTLRDEIFGGIADLERLISRPIRYFAFPFGQKRNLSQEGFQIAHDGGLAGVVSAYGGFNFPGDEPFHIQRFAVDNDLIRLKNWCGVDPRKLRKHPRFDFPASRRAEDLAKSPRLSRT